MRVPSLTRHASRQGLVRIAGRDYYCGHYDQPETRKKYELLIAEYLGNKHSFSNRTKANTLDDLAAASQSRQPARLHASNTTRSKGDVVQTQLHHQLLRTRYQVRLQTGMATGEGTEQGGVGNMAARAFMESQSIGTCSSNGDPRCLWSCAHRGRIRSRRYQYFEDLRQAPTRASHRGRDDTMTFPKL
jgi:hypothetical protein